MADQKSVVIFFKPDQTKQGQTNDGPTVRLKNTTNSLNMTFHMRTDEL